MVHILSFMFEEFPFGFIHFHFQFFQEDTIYFDYSKIGTCTENFSLTIDEDESGGQKSFTCLPSAY